MAGDCPAGLLALCPSSGESWGAAGKPLERLGFALARLCREDGKPLGSGPCLLIWDEFLLQEGLHVPKVLLAPWRFVRFRGSILLVQRQCFLWTSSPAALQQPLARPALPSRNGLHGSPELEGVRRAAAPKRLWRAGGSRQALAHRAAGDSVPCQRKPGLSLPARELPCQ